MSEAIVVAAHADDEVLGASAILASRPTVVVFATDGIPPDALASGTAVIRGVGMPEPRTKREVEAAEAHEVLGARVEEYVRLGFGDQRAAENVAELGKAIARVVSAHEGDVYVPGYQRGHPDHDAVYVAAQLARVQLGRERAQLKGEGARANDATAENTASVGDVPPRRWFSYALYGLDAEGHERFGWLDPGYFPNAASRGGSEAELRTKAHALRRFVSQRPDESVLAGWLRDPVPELYAPLPDPSLPLPALRCFYEEVFAFSQFGIDPERITATLHAALDHAR